MAKDPAFLFYPGDYLRDTQCLSEKSQVAYDRIMCEHMRNICISQQQLNFFTKRLNDDEKQEIISLLKKIDGGFQIDWVAESIEKRRDYSESRRKNRTKKTKTYDKDIKTYDEHMENEIENENEIKINNKKGIIKNLCKIENYDLVMVAFEKWKDYLNVQHSICLLENEYTLDVLIDAIKRVGDGNVVKSIDYSINSGTYKKIYPFREDLKPKKLSHLNQAAKVDSDY